MRWIVLWLFLIVPALAAEGIVVLGAGQWHGEPSPTFAARLDLAFRLWKAGRAPVILVTGGRAPGTEISEGEAGCRYLARLGVPEEALLCEHESQSTWENLLAAKRVFKDAPVVIVTDEPHLPRALLYARRLGLNAEGEAAQGSYLARYRLRERVYYWASLLFPELPATRRTPSPNSSGSLPASRGTAP